MKGKVEILINDLRKRKTPSLSGVILGIIPKGIYEFSDSKVADNYTWVKINDYWVATKEGNYTKIIDLDKKKEEIIKTIKEQLKLLSQYCDDKDILMIFGDDE